MFLSTCLIKRVYMVDGELRLTGTVVETTTYEVTGRSVERSVETRLDDAYLALDLDMVTRLFRQEKGTALQRFRQEKDYPDLTSHPFVADNRVRGKYPHMFTSQEWSKYLNIKELPIGTRSKVEVSKAYEEVHSCSSANGEVVRVYKADGHLVAKVYWDEPGRWENSQTLRLNTLRCIAEPPKKFRPFTCPLR